MKTRAAKPRPKGAAAFDPLPADADLLALDCSSTAIGWAAFSAGEFTAAGLARSPAGWDSVRRIRANTAEIVALMGRTAFSHAVLEWQGPLRAAMGRNVNGLAVLGQAQGYLLAAIEREHPGVRVDLVGEREWTRGEGGGWNVPKARRAARVRMLCREYREAVTKDPATDKGLDIADAIGLGYWRLSR